MFYSTSPAFMLQLILRDVGVAFLPKQMVDEHLVSGKLLRLEINKLDKIYRKLDILAIDNKEVKKIANEILVELQNKFQ